MKLHFKISFISIIILIIVSCSAETDRPPININGGADRDNNYEELGTFYDNFYSVSKINLADSLSGIMIPPLVIDGTRMFVTTTNGMIALIYDLNPQWQH